jgi:hypothetical protein
MGENAEISFDSMALPMGPTTISTVPVIVDISERRRDNVTNE